MNFTAGLFPAWFVWTCDGLSLCVLAVALFRGRWRAITPVQWNAWMGCIVLSMVMWRLHGGWLAGLSFHLLGATLCGLLMGPWRALVALALVLGGLALDGDTDVKGAGVNLLLSGALPLLLLCGVMRLSRRMLPPNVFVYVFVNGFLAGGAGLLLSSLAGIGLLWAFAVYPQDLLFEQMLPYYGLLSWSEAFTTGFLLAVMVVYKPDWVSTFDDARYLGSR